MANTETQQVTENNSYDKLVAFMNKNMKLISAIFGGIVVLIILIFLYKWYLGSLEVDAQKHLASSITYFEADSIDLAMKGDKKNPEAGFENIIANYSGTYAADLSNCYMGLCLIKKSKYKEAIEHLEHFSKTKGSVLTMSAYAALAYACEETNEFAEAAKNYANAARSINSKTSTPTYLLASALNYEAAKDASAAKGIYEEIIKNYPLSPEKEQAEKYLSKISE